MSGRHRDVPRRAAAPTARRLAGAGASAAAAVLAVGPLAHADATPRPVTDTGSTGTDQSTGRADAAKAAKVAPDFGFQKIRVGVQLKDGAFYPSGTTTAGSEITITEKGSGVPDGVLTTTCTTDESTQESGSTATYCTFENDNVRSARVPLGDGIPFNQLYTAQPGDTVTVTQTKHNANMQIDPVAQDIDKCALPAEFNVPICTDIASAVFTDPGLPPVAAHDAGTVPPGGSLTIKVLGNDTTKGAPPVIKIIDKPDHGTAKVVNQVAATTRGAARRAAAAPPAIVYTPDAGFFGHDSLRYSLTTANGTSTATVSLLVAAPPTARDDAASTQTGDAVTIDVLGNDRRNGGGALSIDSVADPGNGTVAIKNGEVVYTPDDGFAGTDTFTYVARNSVGTATATVTVTVSGVANTGAPSGDLITIASLLIAAGGAATVAGRRRYAARHAGGA